MSYNPKLAYLLLAADLACLIHLIDPNPRRLRTHIRAVMGMRVGGFA